jgi:hypothetical protein
MKQKLAAAILAAILSTTLLTGCEEEQPELPMFVKIEQGTYWTVFYHRDTKVMYVVSDASYNEGTFTMLVNADGTPMVYEG